MDRGGFQRCCRTVTRAGTFRWAEEGLVMPPEPRDWSLRRESPELQVACRQEPPSFPMLPEPSPTLVSPRVDGARGSCSSPPKGFADLSRGRAALGGEGWEPRCRFRASSWWAVGGVSRGSPPHHRGCPSRDTASVVGLRTCAHTNIHHHPHTLIHSQLHTHRFTNTLTQAHVHTPTHT